MIRCRDVRRLSTPSEACIDAGPLNRLTASANIESSGREGKACDDDDDACLCEGGREDVRAALVVGIPRR